MSKKLETELKVHHFTLIDGNEALNKEQETLDEHDYDVGNLALCITSLIAPLHQNPALVSLCLEDLLT